MSDTPTDTVANPSSGSPPAASAPTVSHVFGEMVWLLSQSILHRHFQITDLEWLIMPALLHEQFYIFREGDKPVGLALWANVQPQSVKKLEGGLIEPENRLSLAEWNNGDQTWLIDLIAPFANAENRHTEIMMADLIAGPMNGKAFNMHRTDVETGKRQVVRIEADSAAKLKAALEAAVQAANAQNPSSPTQH